jgi:hypothetical protein
MDFEITMEDLNKIEKATRRQASNPNWFKFKKGRITASNVGAVMKMRSLTSNKGVRNKVCYPADTKFSTKATRYGCAHEKEAVALYSTLMKHHVNLKVTTLRKAVKSIPSSH